MAGDALEIMMSVVDLPPGERARAIDEACDGDESLKAEVLELIRLDDTASGFLEPHTSPLTPNPASVIHEMPTPESIGPYRIIERIGEGGFGIVYKGEQTEPIKRLVALKVIKPGMDSEAVLKRFEQERHTLALMDHPNVARVLDGGIIPDAQPGAGRPYFAMEYVEGPSITDYADRNTLGVEERIALFLQACAAAQHAHAKTVIHRDLKPNNILVATVDGRPVCKVIDFGIAKALGEEVRPDLTFTRTGAMIGTPQYMSPEQARGLPDIDTRADVYALGVVLYQLLTGSPPFDAQHLRTPDLERLRRVIEEIEPPVPSSRLAERSRDRDRTPTADTPDLPLPGAPPSTVRRVRGDLDWITMRAMAKEPDRRYATVAALSDDLNRFLKSEPVEAGPPSASYKLSKFVKRNRAGVVAAGVALTLLLAGLAGTSYGLIEARRSEALAREAEGEADAAALGAQLEADKATAINTFMLEDLLEGIDPARNEDRDITMRAVLRRAAERVEGRFEGQPDIEVGVRRTLGNMLQRLGELDSAEVQYRAMLAIEEARDPPDNESTMLALNMLATCLMFQARFDEALPLLDRQVQMHRESGSEEVSGLLLQALGNQGTAYLQTGRYEKATPVLEETLARKRETLGDLDSSTLTSCLNLGSLYVSLGQYERGVELTREAYEGRRQEIGDGDPRTMRAMRNYVWALNESQQSDEAKRIVTEGLERAERRLGPDNPTTVSLKAQLAGTHRELEEFEQAEALYREVHEHYQNTHGDEHYLTIGAAYDLGTTLHYLGRDEEALALVERQVEIEERVTPGHANDATTLVLYGIVLTELGRYDDAEPVILDAHERMNGVLGPSHPRTRSAAKRLADLYTAWDEAEPGAGHGAKAEEWTAVFEASRPEDPSDPG